MKRGFYWRTEDLVVVGLFAALSKAVSLAIALVGGGMNPFTLFLKNGVATALLVVLLARDGRYRALLAVANGNLAEAYPKACIHLLNWLS